MISFSIESSPDTVYLEDLISFQADLKDLDEFPEELSDIIQPVHINPQSKSKNTLIVPPAHPAV